MYQFISYIVRITITTLILLPGVIVTRVQSQNLQRIDSLKGALRNAREGERFEIQFTLFREYLSSDLDQALAFANDALEQAKKIGDSLSIVRASNGQAFILQKKGSLREAIKTFEYALQIAKRNNYQGQEKFLLNNLALAHTANASYDKALKYNFESLKIREAEGNPEAISIAQNNIGLVYHEFGDLENALVYYEKGYQTKIKNGVKYDLENSLINIGLILNEMGKYNQAETKLGEVFALCESKECRPDILMQADQAFGESLLRQKKYAESENYLMKSLALSQKLEDVEYVAANFRLMAELMNGQNRMNEAVIWLDKSQQVASGTNFRKMTLKNYMLYSEIYSDKGDYKKSSYYQDLYIKLYSEIFNADLIKEISWIQTEYAEQQNIKTIAEKDTILGLNEAVIKQQKTLNGLLIAVIALAAILGVVIYRNYTKIKHVNEALASAKSIIEIHNIQLDHQIKDKTRELVDSNETLVKVNDELDNFIYKTSHDIRGPLASLKGIVNLALMDVQDEKAQDYLSKLDLTAEKLNTVLLRLLIVNRINHTELNPEILHFEPLIQELLALEIKKGVPQKIKFDYDVAPNVQITSDKEMVSIVLENLLDNAIKFHNDSERIESFVKIRVISEGENIDVRIRDNGVGISELDREKIFQMFVRASERSETGGIGLYLAKLATEKLGGSINLISGNEKITEFIVRFPKDLQVVIDKRKEEKRKLEEERLGMEVKKKTSGKPDKGFNKIV